MTERLPVQWATYNGDCRGILRERRVPVPDPSHPFGFRAVAVPNAMGPNLLGEALWPVTADYDAETNKTRVGFSYVAPAEGVSA